MGWKDWKKRKKNGINKILLKDEVKIKKCVNGMVTDSKYKIWME